MAGFVARPFADDVLTFRAEGLGPWREVGSSRLF